MRRSCAGFRNVIDSIAFFENGTKTLVDISQFWAGVDSFLWLIGEAVFWLLPVGIVWSITKKMGTTQILGIILGLTLVSSQLLNGFDVASTPADQIPVWDFGFAKVQMIGYQGQVIAAMLAGFVLVYLEKFFRKICPAVVSMIVVPFCSLVPAVFIAHMVVGPVGWTIGNAIADVVYAGLTSDFRFIFAGIFGFLYAPVVMTGLHHMTNAIDSQLISQRIVVTRPELNGKKLGSLHLRNHYGINISRVYRSGVQLLATAELTLQLGDRLTVVGEAAAIQNVEKVLGNAVKSLKEPNLVAVFIGIVIGLALGAIPISIPGISAPVRLGLAGGPIIVGILIGTFGPRMHMVTYTTRSANLMLRALGLSLYLACLGLDAGAHFFDTVFRPEGLLWIATGFALTVVPVLIMGIVTFKWLKIDFGTMAGMLCGSMANPMALNYANDTIPGDNPSVAYATVYPLCMFLRVIIAQVLLMFFING